MKDAIQAMVETIESTRSQTKQNNANSDFIRGPSKKYEKLIQKLEADVRGHIRVSKFQLDLR